MNELTKTAHYWREAGIAVIPIHYMGKTPDAKLLPGGEWAPYQKQLPTIDEIDRWFAGNLHNIGVVTGWQNLVVLDFDELGAYLRWSLWATKQGGWTSRIVDMTYMVRTARGVHVYFRTQQPEQNRKLQNIDVKARGGYVLGHPSIHPSGASYSVLQPGVPMMIEALSEVLPATLLMQNPLPSPSPVHIAPQILSDDPWTVVMQGPDPDHDLVSQVRTRYRVEDFFSDADSSSADQRWLMAKCPFHDDRHPSFWIDTQRQICGCHAGCTPKPLDVINLYARLHGLTNRDAILFMAKAL